jgi:hypothetical protein
MVVENTVVSDRVVMWEYKFYLRDCVEKMLHAGNRLTAVRGWLTVHGTNHKMLGTGFSQRLSN